MGGRDSGGRGVEGICTVSGLGLIEKRDGNHNARAPAWTHRVTVKNCIRAQTRNCAKGCRGEWDGAAEKEKSEGLRFLQHQHKILIILAQFKTTKPRRTHTCKPIKLNLHGFVVSNH